MQECCGVVPLAQCREPYTAVRFLGEHLPLERLYGLTPSRDELEDLLESEAATRSGRLPGGAGTLQPDDGDNPYASQGGRGAALTAAAARYVWSPLSLCEALAMKRGYFIAKTGRPDSHAAGREILYDAQDGLLPLWWLPPAEAPTTSAAAVAKA